MAMNFAKIMRTCMTRENGHVLRTLYFSSSSITENSCRCHVRPALWDQLQFFRRDINTSAAVFQLGASIKPKDSISEQDLATEAELKNDRKTSLPVNDKENPDLQEMYKSQKKRLLEEPDELEPHVIYKGILGGNLKRVKILSITSSLCGFAMQPVLYQNSGEVPLLANVAIFGCVGFFTYVTPLLIHSLTKKYVTEMIYDPQKDLYIAVTFSFFLRRREAVFKIEDVKIPDVPGPFTTFLLKTKDGKDVPYFVAPEAFIKHSHYGRLMGYDKPVDLRLSKNNKEAKS